MTKLKAVTLRICRSEFANIDDCHDANGKMKQLMPMGLARENASIYTCY